VALQVAKEKALSLDVKTAEYRTESLRHKSLKIRATGMQVRRGAK
jgi:hypothetical protein